MHEQRLGGDRKELNPFQWEQVQLNLPGNKTYNPCQPWMAKTRANGRIACNVFTFLVDDKRVTGPDKELTW